MQKNILDRAVDYLKFQEESFGPLIYIDENSAITDSDNKSSVTKENDSLNANSNTTSQTEFTKPITSKINGDAVSGIDDNWEDSNSLIELNKAICNCMECKLGNTRKNFVFGSGNPNADILVIGEAPGADEDEQGLPFVGKAGQLLTKILESVRLSRDEVYIANIVKCRPPNNRRPEKEEVDNCEPYLIKQIELIKPQFILSLGLTSVDTLLKKSHKMADVRGKLLDYQGIKMLVTYHPAALLRNPNWKKFVWEDIQYLRKLYDDYKSVKK